MKTRCNNKGYNRPDYKNYKENGIKVDNHWTNLSLRSRDCEKYFHKISHNGNTPKNYAFTDTIISS